MNRDEIKKTLRELFPYGDPMFYEIIGDLCQLHNDKNRDYASKKDPLQNFNRVAEWGRKYNLITKGNEEVKVALLYAMKQWDAVLKLIGSNEVGKVEGVTERLSDISVYAVLAMILYRRNSPK